MIPVNEPRIGAAEQEAVAQAMASGWISGQGAFVDRFERLWAEVCDRKHAVSVSSGTAALETAVHALGLPEGSEVIMPTFSMISCLAAVLRNGLVPIFVDANPNTWCMEVDQLAAAVTGNTSAIMVVHIYGQPVEMDPVLAIANKHRLKIVEDAAEAHGARYRGRICGSFGDASVFSFYSNKIVTTGEGGMVVCDDDRIAEDCRNYRNLYFDRRYRFLHGRLGHNFRLTNLQAAIGCVQTEQLADALDQKSHMARLYDKLLSDVVDLQLPPRTDHAENVHWVYGIVLGDRYPFDARELSARLRQAGVDSRQFFLGMHEQPVTREAGLATHRKYPVAERLSRRGLYLPSGLTLTEAQIEIVARTLKRCLKT